MEFDACYAIFNIKQYYNLKYKEDPLMIVDHISDKNYAGLHMIAKSCNMPDFANKAPMDSDMDKQAMTLTSFADPQNRNYPINTQEDAWFSCAYFEKFAIDNKYSVLKYANIKLKLEKAAKLWDFDWPVFFAEKEASAITTIAYVSNGETLYTSEVFEFAGLDKLANDLIANRNKYPWDMRRDAAKQILAAGNEFETNFKEASINQLQKIAGQAVGLLKEAQQLLLDRRQAFFREPDVQIRIQEVHDTIEKTAVQGFISPEMANHVIGLLDMLDRINGDNSKYASQGQAPEDIIFAVTLQDMDMLNAHMVKLANGQAITKNQAGSQKTAHFLKAVTGVEVNSPAEAIKACRLLDERTADILAKAM